MAWRTSTSRAPRGERVALTERSLHSVLFLVFALNFSCRRRRTAYCIFRNGDDFTPGSARARARKTCSNVCASHTRSKTLATTGVQHGSALALHISKDRMTWLYSVILIPALRLLHITHTSTRYDCLPAK